MFKEYAANNNIELIVQSAEDDPQKQISQCENMITQGVDALIVQPWTLLQPVRSVNLPKPLTSLLFPMTAWS